MLYQQKDFNSWEDPGFCSFRKKYPAKYFGSVFKEDLETVIAAFSTCQGDGTAYFPKKEMLFGVLLINLYGV